MITITTIPHDKQRYDTIGDWQFKEGELTIKVLQTGNSDYNNLIAIHEIIEAILCKNAFISEEKVDKWDMDHLDSNDPGSITGCPYYRQHFIATIIERMIADEINVNWQEYEKVLENL